MQSVKQILVKQYSERSTFEIFALFENNTHDF